MRFVNGVAPGDLMMRAAERGSGQPVAWRAKRAKNGSADACFSLDSGSSVLVAAAGSEYVVEGIETGVVNVHGSRRLALSTQSALTSIRLRDASLSSSERAIGAEKAAGETDRTEGGTEDEISLDGQTTVLRVLIPLLFFCSRTPIQASH